jgi:hypothetical protein
MAERDAKRSGVIKFGDQKQVVLRGGVAVIIPAYEYESF